MEFTVEDGLDIKGKEGNRIYSKEEKKCYYELWRNSGLSKTAFSKANGLNSKTFSNWCKVYTKEEEKKVEFARVVSSKGTSTQLEKRQGIDASNALQIEILRNGISCQIKINLSLPDALCIIKGLCDGR